MRKLHLIANAHLDPVWQWDWQEGASAAIATFQSAVNLAEEFDYIFCHNEVLLYEYTEEYAPQLFEKIKELVKKGKWHIIGGWYLQPDCNMPSGESFVRQIQVGKEYFLKKFGVFPKTAINFDSFGHSRGIVQIIKKCGQDSNIIMRPYEHQCILEHNCFLWQGFDGSEISVARSPSYRTPLGVAREWIEKDYEKNKDEDIWFCLWGVGNHGGGPSRKDLSDILKLAKEKESEVEIVHSTPENFFAEVKPMFTYDKSLRLCMPGCYVSMNKLKHLHISLENQLYMTEKICSIAYMNGLSEYPKEQLKEAEKDLLNSEFHDILPGSSIKNGEQIGVRFLNHGLQICEKAYFKAFFALTQNQDKAKEGEYPILVFNPHPHALKTVVDVEFTLADQNFDEKQSVIKVYDESGNILISQKSREKSSLNCDWRKRVLFECELKPMQMNRFSIFVDFDYVNKQKFDVGGIKVKTNVGSVTINDEGLISSYIVNGKEYIKGDAFAPYCYDDNADPWAMSDEQRIQLGINPTKIPVTYKNDSIFKNSTGVKVIEDGDVCTKIQACFSNGNIKLHYIYTVYKTTGYVDIHVDLFFNEADKIVKLHVPTVFTNGNFRGQAPFGIDDLAIDGSETVALRFSSAGNNEEGERLAIINDCIYGSSFYDGEIRLSLVRGAGYCVHPVDNMPLMSDTDYVDRIDQGECTFDFRMQVCYENELEDIAMVFNQKPYALNMFPCFESKYIKDIINYVELSNNNVVLSAMKKTDGKEDVIIRLFNNSEKETKTEVNVMGHKKVVFFGKYEVKTFSVSEKQFVEEKELVI